MRPPSGVQRNAFESRFVMIWSTRSPSVMSTGLRAQLAAVVDPAAPRLFVERRVGALDEVLHVDLLLQHGEAARVELREVEHVADEPREPLGLLGDDVERDRARLFVLDEPLAQRGDVAADRGQRRAQLVRHGHQEVPLELLGLAQPPRHLAEAVRESDRSRCRRGTAGTATS